jgi:hypothetical protein
VVKKAVETGMEDEAKDLSRFDTLGECNKRIRLAASRESDIVLATIRLGLGEIS